MPWQERRLMSLREEFVALACSLDSNIRDLCQQFGISRKTGYKWLKRYQADGVAGLQDRSRCPHRTPRKQVSQSVQDTVLQVRRQHRWGARKIQNYLLRDGVQDVPSVSTVHAIIQRHGCEPLVERPFATMHRFEADAPNDLWQMDFKGPIQLLDGVCEPHTVIDDHSRFCLTIQVGNKRTATVQTTLTGLFRRCGMPASILADNGKPWGGRNQHCARYWTQLEVWLMSLGIRIRHSRIYHPQTCGKNERFHRTLKQELGPSCQAVQLAEIQVHFDAWREVYNTIRPHEALDMAVPCERYGTSERAFPEIIAGPEYDTDDLILRAGDKGAIRLSEHRTVRLGHAFYGRDIALRMNRDETKFNLYFYKQRIASVERNIREKV